MHCTRLLIAVVAAVLSTASIAAADTIVLTGGSLTLFLSSPESEGSGAGFFLNLVGRDFRFDGHGEAPGGFFDFGLEPCLIGARCAPGDASSARMNVCLADDDDCGFPGRGVPRDVAAFGSLTFGGTTYENAFLTGSFGVPETPVILPRGKFRLDSRSALIGFADVFQETVIFPEHRFVGSGTFTFVGFPQPGVVEARYDFMPTPEPSTIALFGAGVATTLVRRRRQKAR